MTFVTSALPPELVPYAQDLEEFKQQTGIRLSLPPLGIGGGGTVLKAENKYGKHMAVKVIAAEDAESQDQALREASILKQVQHVKAYGGGEGLLWQKHYQQIHLFILGLDYIPGQTLTELLTDEGPLDEATAIAWTIAIARELDALHGRHIIHRDVKPDNIMMMQVGKGYQPVVVDYGIAKVGNHRTRRGARAATDGYAPPEQYSGGTDRRTDVYALGATLYEMVTGLTPLASLNRDPRAPLEPRRYNPKISPALEQVIQIATAYDPQQRFATMTALVDALQLVEEGNLGVLRSTLHVLGLLPDGSTLPLASVPALPPLPAQRQKPAPAAAGACGNRVPAFSASPRAPVPRARKAAAPAAGLLCPYCQTPYQVGEAFCDGCGSALDAAVQAACSAVPPAPAPVVGGVGIPTPRTPGPQFLSLLFAHQIVLGGPALGTVGKALLVLGYWLLLTSITLGAHALSYVCALAGGLTVGCLVSSFMLIFPFAQILLHWDDTVITRRGQAHWLRRGVVMLLGLGGSAGMLYWLAREVVIWRFAWIVAPPPISILVYLGLAGCAVLLMQALLA